MNEIKFDDSTEGFQEAKFGPKTRYIPTAWDVGRLGDNTYLKGRIGWHGLTQDDHLEEGQYYLVTGTDFENGEIQWDQCKYVNEDWYQKDPNIQLEENDILVTKDGSIGKVAFVDSLPNDATLNNGIFVLRPLDEEYEPLYFYYVLNSFYFEDFIETITAGSTISHLYQKDFVNFRFPLPPLTEQRRIANILSIVDKEIQLINKSIDKLIELKKGLMQDLFTEGLHEEDKKGTDSRYGKIPKTWNLQKLKDIGEVVGRTAPEKDQTECWGGNIPWATPSEITSLEGPIIEDTEEHLTELALEKVSSNLLPPGSVLLTTRATIGECAVNEVEMTTNQGFKSLVPGDNLDTWYAYYRLKYEGDYLASLSKGSTFPEVGKDIVENFLIPVPQLEEQKQIGEYLRSVDRVLVSYRSDKEQVQELKRGLMQDLLTGKVRVDDIDVDNLNQGKPSTDE